MASEAAAEAGEADEPTAAHVSETPAIEWTFAVEEVQPEFAEDAGIEEESELEPLAEDALAVDPVFEEPDAEAAFPPVPDTDTDTWETPEAEWPRQEVEHVDPVELAVPALEPSGFDEEAPLTFASEDAVEIEGFAPEPEPVAEPVPELPPVPRNALRARLYQMEEVRQTRGTSLLGRIWQRLFG